MALKIPKASGVDRPRSSGSAHWSVCEPRKDSFDLCRASSTPFPSRRCLDAPRFDLVSRKLDRCGQAHLFLL
jgi:hypothetical protein